MSDKFKLCYSFDEEFYHGEYDTIEDIVKDLIESEFEIGKEFICVYIGEAVTYKDKGSDCYNNIIDMFKENAYEVGGEWSENYLETIDPEHEKFLKDKLDEIWAEFKNISKENNPFYTVYSTDRYKVYLDGRYELINED